MDKASEAIYRRALSPATANHPDLRIASPVIAEASSENRNSDEHSDRPFSFIGMKGKTQQQREQKI
jgi:hypothetical protein